MSFRSSSLLSRSVRRGARFLSSRVGGSLKGKVAVISASTDGIGYAIARRLGSDGASVVISSRKEENVKLATSSLIKEGIDAIGTVCHVGNSNDRENLIETAVTKKGGIDIFVSNAGANPAFGRFLETNERQWDKIFDTNVKSSFFLCKAVIPELEKRGGGSVVFVSSIGGYLPLPAIGAYSVSKTALLGLTKALASEVASLNIRVNCVCPGIIETKFSSALSGDDEIRNYLLNSIPLRRLGKAEEISGLVAFLCSDDASYITGESFVAAGGMYSRL